MTILQSQTQKTSYKRETASYSLTPGKRNIVHSNMKHPF